MVGLGKLYSTLLPQTPPKNTHCSCQTSLLKNAAQVQRAGIPEALSLSLPLSPSPSVSVSPSLSPSHSPSLFLSLCPSLSHTHTQCVYSFFLFPEHFSPSLALITFPDVTWPEITRNTGVSEQAGFLVYRMEGAHTLGELWGRGLVTGFQEGLIIPGF